ncbi:porin [Simplicispira psychrophila]|uniref:porin n=1 Tax=Simplicispira psychrophila TaxID=80882 RepID=UPI000480114E|nr:porin [Simplicispira psychrophila]
MKKSLIALAVLAASGAAMAQSSVTLFGIVDTGVGYVKNSGGDNKYGLANSGNATSRLGFRGVEDLGGGLKAGFWLEGEITPDDGTAAGLNFKRRSTLSLMGGFGEVRLGRDLTAGYKTSAYDLFGQVGMGQFLGWSGNLTGTTGDFNGVRASNMLAYYTPNFGGFTGALNYGFGESTGSNKTNRYIGGYAAYDNGPISVTVSLDKNNQTVGLGFDADRTQLSVGASYDLGMLKVSGLVQRVKFEDNLTTAEGKYTNYLLGVSAPVGPGTVKLQYAAYDLKNSKDDAQQLSVGYVYDLSKRTAVYGTAAFLKNKNFSDVNLGGVGLPLAADAGRNQTGFQVGIRHAF